MPSSKKKMKPKVETSGVPKLDLDPDAWPKFEKLIKSAAKMGPRPHSQKGSKPK